MTEIIFSCGVSGSCICNKDVPYDSNETKKANSLPLLAKQWRNYGGCCSNIGTTSCSTLVASRCIYYSWGGEELYQRQLPTCSWLPLTLTPACVILFEEGVGRNLYPVQGIYVTVGAGAMRPQTGNNWWTRWWRRWKSY